MALREANELEAAATELETAGAIVLECLAASVPLPAVGLDGQPLLAEEEIDREGPNADVDLRRRQAVAATKGEEDPLELAAGPIGADVIERETEELRLTYGLADEMWRFGAAQVLDGAPRLRGGDAVLGGDCCGGEGAGPMDCDAGVSRPAPERNRDVNGLNCCRHEGEELSRAAMAQDGPFAAGENGRHPAAFVAQGRMANRINASVHEMKPAGVPAAVDSNVTEPAAVKLPGGHLTVLSIGEPGDLLVDCGEFLTYRQRKAPQTRIRPRVDCAARSLTPQPTAFSQPSTPPQPHPLPSVSAQFSVTIRVELDARQEPLGKLTASIAEAGGQLQGVDLVPGAGSEGKRVREFTIDATDQEHWERILRSIGSTRGAKVLDYTDRTMQMHRGGKIEQANKYPLKTRDDLSMAYTPGVARVCQEIHADRSKAFEYTIKKNTVAVVSDGSAVLGLGDIGPEAAMPVMEGKAMLFKEFAEVDAFPICLSTHDPDEIVRAVELMAPTFGGINLEDISAPRCFEIEDRLKESLDIPVFHDDQHGTAVVTMAALFNALKITGKPIEELRVLMVGLGAAGVAVTKMMLASGVTHIVGCDRQGALSTTRDDYDDGMTEIKRWYADNSNPEHLLGGPNELLEGMDMLIGLSGPGLIQPDSLGKMNDDAIVFAMANPTPEVMPEDAAPHVRIMATGRSDYPNQINNVLAFPGIFRGALDAGAPQITEEMKLAAAKGIAGVVHDDDLSEDYIIPSVFNRDVAPAVAEAVVQEAKSAGIARFSDETGTFQTVDGNP